MANTISKIILFGAPNFKEEWREAERYAEFKEMGQKGFIEFALKNGKVIQFSKIKSKGLGNFDPNFDKLNPDKKKRFFKAFAGGKIEMSIFIKWNSSQHEMMAGNTRVSGLNMLGIDPPIWCIDMAVLGNKY